MKHEPRADINAMNSIGRTALINAAYKGHKDIVLELLKHGADFEAKKNDCKTAREMAEAKGKTEIVELLEAHAKACMSSSSPTKLAVKESAPSPMVAAADINDETIATVQAEFKAEDSGTCEENEEYFDLFSCIDSSEVLQFFSPPQ